jgi:hypothetical protein
MLPVRSAVDSLLCNMPCSKEFKPMGGLTTTAAAVAAACAAAIVPWAMLGRKIAAACVVWYAALAHGICVATTNKQQHCSQPLPWVVRQLLPLLQEPMLPQQALPLLLLLLLLLLANCNCSTSAAAATAVQPSCCQTGYVIPPAAGAQSMQPCPLPCRWFQQPLSLPAVQQYCLGPQTYRYPSRPVAAVLPRPPNAPVPKPPSSSSTA